MPHLSYKKAMAAPTGKKGKGWKYAEGDSLRASRSWALSIIFCMNAKSIYDWSLRHFVPLDSNQKLFKKLSEDPDILVAAVLNDWPIEKTKAKLKEAG